MPKVKIFRLIHYVSIVGITATIGLLLGSCASLPTGPYYQPVYPQESKYVWSFRNNAGLGVLGMRSGACVMFLRANAGDKNFTLSWLQQESKKEKRTCQIHVHDGPIVVEDLDTGSRLDIRIFQRAFSYGPGLDINQAVDLDALVPGFAAVPKSERRYALSIDLKRTFKGSLPDEVKIQLPDIQLGDRSIQVPPLRLKRYERSGKGWWYAPATAKEVQETKPAGKALGSLFQTLVYKPADIWYEEESVIRLSASFRGVPFTWNSDWTKRNDDESNIDGEIFVEVLGDEPVRLTSDRVSWRVPGDKIDELVPVARSKWILKTYTTVNLAERVDYLPDYSLPTHTYDDWLRDFRVVIPGFQPKRFRVTLPHVDVNGHKWPIQPIDFEYK